MSKIHSPKKDPLQHQVADVLKSRAEKDPRKYRIDGKGISLTVEKIADENDISRLTPEERENLYVPFTFNRHISHIEQWAKDTLEPLFDADDMYVDPAEARISDRWYAKRMLELIIDAHVSIKFGHIDWAARYAFELGKLFQQHQDMSLYNKDTISGMSVKIGGHDGGIVRGKQQTTSREKEWEKWQTEADKIWKKHPTWGKPAIAKMVHEKYPGSTARTIRLRIKKPVS